MLHQISAAAHGPDNESAEIRRPGFFRRKESSGLIKTPG